VGSKHIRHRSADQVARQQSLDLVGAMEKNCSRSFAREAPRVNELDSQSCMRFAETFVEMFWEHRAKGIGEDVLNAAMPPKLFLRS